VLTAKDSGEAGAATGWEVAGDASPVLCRDARGTTSAGAVDAEFAAVVEVACAPVIAVLLWFVVCAARRAISAVALRVIVQLLCCAASPAIWREVMWAALRGVAQARAAAGLHSVRLPATWTQN
jgi:hypothetical protein